MNCHRTFRKDVQFSDVISSQNLAYRLTSRHHERMSAEIHATDSYQNLLFSILHFHSLTSGYPAQITLISHAFKRPRFLDLHCRALRWPLSRVTYIGLDPPENVTPRNVLEQGELERGYGVWEDDLYGVGSVLGEKREKRGWEEDALETVVRGKDGSVDRLLEWKGGVDGREVYTGRLPWDT